LLVAWNRWIGLVAVVLCLSAIAFMRSRANAPPEQDTEWPARGDEVIRLVREHFYDRKTAGGWAAKHADYARTAESAERFAALTKEALSGLKVSHTGFFTTQDPEYYGLLAIFANALNAGQVEWDSPGADITADHFVRVVFADGPADKAGLRRGDRILKADDKDFHAVTSFRDRSGQPVTLTVQRKGDQPPIKIRITPRRINPAREWLEAEEKGAKSITRKGKTVGYVPLFSCAGDAYQNALQEMLSDRLRDADALILDFRDGFGGCNPEFVNLLNQTPAVLTYIDRNGKHQRFDSQWRKPLVVLINGGTRSGKEVVAYSIKKHRLGTLVGQRTAGAVVGGRCFLLSDRSLLFLAVRDLLVDGQRLEGQGVNPDVEVLDVLPFANGADPQLDRAIEIATR
jgi:carboxyl-terminal processing protease